MISVVLLWARDTLYSLDYLYGLGSDKKSFLRSDDFGYSWKLICESEFNHVNVAFFKSYYSKINSNFCYFKD